MLFRSAPIKKPWTVLTTNHALASDLGEQTCLCKTKHTQCQGRDTKRSENYTPAMAKLIVRSLKRSQSPNAGTSYAAQLADPNAVLLAMLECHPWRKQTHRTGIAKSHVRTFHTSKSGTEYSKRRVTEPQQSEYHATGPIVDHVRTMLPDDFTPGEFFGVMINRNTVCQPHRDKQNLGESCIMFLRDYKGGALILDDGRRFEKRGVWHRYDGRAHLQIGRAHV